MRLRARLRSHAPAAAHFPLWVATRLARSPVRVRRDQREGTSPGLASRHCRWCDATAGPAHDAMLRTLCSQPRRMVVQCSLHCLRTPVCSDHCPTRHEQHCNSELRFGSAVPTHVCKVPKTCPPLRSYSDFEEEHEQRGVPCTVHLSITRAQLVVGIATSQQRFSAWSASHLFIDDIYYCNNIYMCIKTPSNISITAPN